MKLMYIAWGYAQDAAIIRALEGCGLAVEQVAVEREWMESGEAEVAARQQAEEYLQRKNILSGDIVFSVNFSSLISDFCQQQGMPYCSWVLALPNFDLYTGAVKNSCNYIGICDSYLVEKLWQIGVGKAFFLPDAVEISGSLQKVTAQREICVILQQPQADLHAEKLSLYGQGYLDAFLHAQRVLQGAYILEDGLTSRVQQEFMADKKIPIRILPELEKLYTADRYFAPACTILEQNVLLKNNDNIMTIYSDHDFPLCHCEKYPYVEEEKKRREIYAAKEFTLVLAPRILHNGIPRQALEVIEAGGFPVCAYQKDYGYFFKKDENLAYFIDSADLSRLIVRYGNSNEEWLRMKEQTYQTVVQGHTYRHRILLMLEMWDKLS